MSDNDPIECGCGLSPDGELTRQRCHRLYQIHGGHSSRCVPLALVRARLEELGDLTPELIPIGSIGAGYGRQWLRGDGFTDATAA
jgi:hypothetical protein